MIQGIEKFSAKVPESPFFATGNSPEEMAARITEAEARISSWLTLMNIFEMKQWSDPLTGDIHLVIRKNRLLEANHIGEAVEEAKE